MRIYKPAWDPVLVLVVARFKQFFHFISSLNLLFRALLDGMRFLLMMRKRMVMCLQMLRLFLKIKHEVHILKLLA